LSAEIHVGDVGTVFEATVVDEDGVAVDVSTATTKQIVLMSPADTELARAATFSTDGTDGKLYYVSTALDLTVAGLWERQVYVVMPSGTWHSDISTFVVHGNL
jgi:hypothetical protein